jgi:hypothetical protein
MRIVKKQKEMGYFKPLKTNDFKWYATEKAVCLF